MVIMSSYNSPEIPVIYFIQYWQTLMNQYIVEQKIGQAIKSDPYPDPEARRILR